MAQYKVTYFNIRGRAELIRLIFAVAGVEYEDNRIEREQWPALKPSAPFGQVPIIEFDGKTFCQSFAIARYLARKFKLAGKTELEDLQIDMIVDCTEDALKPTLNIFTEKDETKKATLTKKYSEEQLPASYENLEKLLKSNKGGDGFFVGDGLTWADLQFLVLVEWVRLFGVDTILEKYPKLKALQRRIESVPQVAAWIAKRPVTEF